jgi:hypothetical protein
MSLQTLTAEEVYSAAASAGARPDPLLTISEWADQYRTLSQRVCRVWAVAHRRTPCLREMMD